VKIKICNKSDIQNNKSVKFTIPGKKFDRDGFLIMVKDELHAYYNECPHIGLTLDWEDNDFFSLDFSRLVCKNHGAVFQPETGSCNQGPCEGAALKQIDVIVENDIVYAKLSS